jgi:hypothetical protein
LEAVADIGELFRSELDALLLRVRPLLLAQGSLAKRLQCSAISSTARVSVASCPARLAMSSLAVISAGF